MKWVYPLFAVVLCVPCSAEPGLFFGATHQAGSQAGRELVIPTKIVSDPGLFDRGQVISVKASFKQVKLKVVGEQSNGFQVRVYDEKDVSSEPVYTTSKETKYIAWSNATVGPKDEDDDKEVERDFEQFQIPQNASARVYAAIWRVAGWKRLKWPGDPSIYEEGVDTKLIGGQFFKFSCPGKSRIPTEKCAYRPE